MMIVLYDKEIDKYKYTIKIGKKKGELIVEIFYYILRKFISVALRRTSLIHTEKCLSIQFESFRV